MTNSNRFVLYCSLNDNSMDGSGHLFRSRGMFPVSYPKEADLIIFNGGADIGTSIYGEEPIYAGIPRQPSRRDRDEIEVFERNPKTFKVGICRGAQLLNCLNGGTLWQDVNNHGRTHKITDTRTGEIYEATSTHHQMMRPNYKTGQIIAIADEATRKEADPDNWISKAGVHYADDHKDTEIVWYPNTRSLCIQGHPEYVPNSKFANYCFELIHNFMNEVQSCVV